MNSPSSVPQPPRLGGSLGSLINVPNTITCLNLISGCIATYWALSGRWELALLFIVVGAVFDFFDGMTARLLHVSSPIGKELDSLADDITFGFAPSAIIFSFLKNSLSLGEGWGEAFPYIAFIMAAFSALRLAKFNLDERQAMGFIGLPTPANALFWASLIVGQAAFLASPRFNALWLFLFMLMFCFFLVAEVPLFALKFKTFGWEENRVKYTFMAVAIVILFLGYHTLGVSVIAAIILWYIIWSLLVWKVR